MIVAGVDAVKVTTIHGDVKYLVGFGDEDNSDEE